MPAKTVDDYLQALSDEQRSIAQTLRLLVLQAAPGTSESIKWSQPVFDCGGPMCWIKAHKAHVTFGFWRGMQLPSAPGVLQGGGEKMAHLKLSSPAQIQPALLKKLVREAARLNQERGDPTRSP